MIAATKTAAGLRPGDAMPKARKTFSSANLVMYGAATWDWHRLHHDDAFAHKMGLPAPVIDGQIYGALFAKQATGWLGPKAFVRRLSFRMRSMAFAGDTLHMAGQVSQILTEEDCPIVVLSQQLTKDDDIVAEATTEVRLPD